MAFTAMPLQSARSRIMVYGLIVTSVVGDVMVLRYVSESCVPRRDT